MHCVAVRAVYGLALDMGGIGSNWPLDIWESRLDWILARGVRFGGLQLCGARFKFFKAGA